MPECDVVESEFHGGITINWAVDMDVDGREVWGRRRVDVQGNVSSFRHDGPTAIPPLEVFEPPP